MSEICIDTYKMEQYADRLGVVNRRVTQLDFKMDRLYVSAGLFDLGKILRADLLTHYNIRIKLCQNYLNSTAKDFVSVEQRVNRIEPLNFRKSYLVMFGGQETQDEINLKEIKKYMEKAGKNIEKKFQKTKSALSNSINKIMRFCEDSPLVCTLGDLGMDAVNLFASVYGMTTIDGIVTGFWDLANFIPTAGCDLIALCVPAIGKIAGKDETWISEQSKNFRSIDSWADYIAYEDSGYKTLESKSKSRIVKGLEKIDTMNSVVKSTVGGYKTVKGAFTLGKDISNIYDVGKGTQVMGDDGKLLDISLLKRNLYKDLSSSFLTIKSPTGVNQGNVWSDINTGLKTGKHILDGEFGDVWNDMIKPAKTGKEIGKTIVEIESSTKEN